MTIKSKYDFCSQSPSIVANTWPLYYNEASWTRTMVLSALTVGRAWLIIWAISPMKSPIPCSCNHSRKHHSTVIIIIMQHRANRCLRCPHRPHCHILPHRRGTACWHQRGLHKNNGIGAQGLHAISLPTGYIGRFAGVRFISCWLVLVTSEVGWVANMEQSRGRVQREGRLRPE